MLQNLTMIQSGKIKSKEDVMCTSVLYFLIYGGKKSIASLKKFVNLMVLTSYIPECTTIGSQT